MNDTTAENSLTATAESGEDAALMEQPPQGSDTAEAAGNQSRARDRFPIASCLQLIPLDRNGRLRHSQTLDVIGKDLSTSGIAFSHMTPLLYQRGVISFTKPDGDRFSVEVEVLWSRQSPIGLYETGCRLVRKLDIEPV